MSIALSLVIVTVIVIVIVALLLADFLRWRRGRRAVQRSFQIARVRGFDIPYLVVGPPDGPPVLLSTGGGAGIDSVHAMPWLTDAGYRLIAICRPGYYGVPLEAAPSLRAQADLYAEVLCVLGVREPVHVFGVSAGGPTALHYAAKHPTRSLLLWCAVTGRYTPNQASMDSALGRLVLFTRGQALISWLLSRSARWIPRTTMATFLRTESTLGKPQIDAVVDQTLACAAHRRRFRTFVDSTTPMTELYPGMMDELHKMGEDWTADWARIRAPTLAVASAVDKDVGADHIERVARRLPSATILEVRAGGHLVWWGREGEGVIEASLRHLARYTPAGPARGD
ncbi:MAG: alpha/beta hydrolase [Myxococcota bacterium]